VSKLHDVSISEGATFGLKVLAKLLSSSDRSSGTLPHWRSHAASVIAVVGGLVVAGMVVVGGAAVVVAVLVVADLPPHAANASAARQATAAMRSRLWTPLGIAE
jgi:hypothetical protein